MKKDKVIQNLRSIRVVLTLVFAFFIASTAWADSWPEYITDLKVIGGSESDVNNLTSSLRSKGWTRIEQDLNKGAGGDYVYLFYKKGSRNDPNGGYITDLTIRTSNDNSFKKNGRTYSRVAHDGNDHFKKYGGNLNSGTKESSTNMWIYYTKANFSDKRVVDRIWFTSGDEYENSGASGAVDGIDLNEGAGGKYIYMHFSTTTKTNRPKTDPTMVSGLVYTGKTQQLIATGASLFEGTKMRYDRSGYISSISPNYRDIYAKDAGTYDVIYYLEKSDYAAKSEEHTQKVTIAKSNNRGVSVNIASSYVEGETLSPYTSGTNLSTGSITYQYSESENGTYTSTKPTKPGSHWVKAFIAEDINCNKYTTPAKQFKIIPSVAYATIGAIPAQTYTGSMMCPVVSVNYKGTELKAGVDYTVSCSYNVYPGTGSITITGMGTYAGSTTRQFEILKAKLTITAKNASIFYGDERPNAGVEYNGFVNGENEQNLKGTLAISYNYVQYSDVGEYAITPSGLTADNYDIEYVAGKLKVEPKIISIAWGEQTVFTYDGEEHAPTATAEGLLNNDECELAVTGAAVNPGNYTATVTGLSNTNYKLPESGTEKEFKIVGKPVEYIDEKGETKTVTDYTVLTNDISVDELSGGWYVVQGEVKYTSRIKFSGDAHLILADGAKMEIETEGEVEEGILTNGNLTIYGQSMQSGILNVASTGRMGFGIMACNDITINGGTVEATGNGFGIYVNNDVSINGGTITAASNDNNGIYSGRNVTISDGTVTATGNYNGIYSNGTVTISGGTVEAKATGGNYGIYGSNGVTISGGKVTATSESYGIYSNGTVTISGGTVEATGANRGIYSWNGNITLSWTNSTDFVKASSYYSKNGVSITEGKFFKDEKGNVYSGPLSDDDLESIKNKTLVPSFNGTYLSDVNIAVADIPVQKYADGKPVCPSVLVTDGKDTLKAGSDYTVTCVNNTAVTTATLDEAAVVQITGKGNYAGAIQKRFFIWKNVGNYAAVQVFEDADGKTHAEIDGAYDGTDAVAIDEDITVESVVFNRDFPKGKYSTTVLPFDVNTANVEGLDAVLRYNGIKTVSGVSSIRMKVVWATDEWVKTNNIMDDDGDYKRYPDVNLTANTPYLVQMGDATTFYVKGTVTLKSTGPTDVSIDGWTFRGTWQYKKWGPSCSTEGQNCDRETGNAYGFAASSSDDDKINVGDFVRVGEGAWILPMRAYLVSTKILESTSPAQLARANGNYVKRPSFAQEDLPEFMSIVIDVDDEGKETTVIGQFNTRTGEIKMNYDRGKFDLKGRRVNGTNNARGAYYGKKVLKK